VSRDASRTTRDPSAAGRASGSGCQTASFPFSPCLTRFTSGTTTSESEKRETGLRAQRFKSGSPSWRLSNFFWVCRTAGHAAFKQLRHSEGSSSPLSFAATSQWRPSLKYSSFVQQFVNKRAKISDLLPDVLSLARVCDLVRRVVAKLSDSFHRRLCIPG
jgi:hypothetical protein